VSFDLIYARQNQSLEAWGAELNLALSLAIDHLSLYQLTIEGGTAFGDRYAAGKLRGLPDEDSAADMFEVTQRVCEAAGFPAYEVSNHAKSGAESIHNKIYWQYGDYAGIGPGAHGRVTIDGQRFATEAPLAPGLWLKQVNETGNGELLRDSLSGTDQTTEFLLMGLRLNEGVDLSRLPVEDFGDLSFKINELTAMELIETREGRLLVSQKGRPILNAVLRHLLDD
jgi:oxygen-independent coproporphyrinogen-3 oxidase